MKSFDAISKIIIFVNLLFGYCKQELNIQSKGISNILNYNYMGNDKEYEIKCIRGYFSFNGMCILGYDSITISNLDNLIENLGKKLLKKLELFIKWQKIH